MRSIDFAPLSRSTIGFDRMMQLFEDATRLGDGESPEQFEKLLDAITDLVQSVRMDGSFAYVNRAWRETLGYPETAGKYLRVRRDVHKFTHHNRYGNYGIR